MSDQKTEQKPEHEKRIREASEEGPYYTAMVAKPDLRALLADMDAMRGALEDCLDRIEKSEFWWMDCPDRGGFDAEAIRAALSEAKAGGWVAVQSEPWGWAIVSNDGTTQATRARIRDFFGSHLEMPPYMQAEIAQVDREWAGLAPHRIVTLYALPAPPAQKEPT